MPVTADELLADAAAPTPVTADELLREATGPTSAVTADDLLADAEADRSPVLPAAAERFLRAHPTVAEVAAAAVNVGFPIAGGAVGTLLPVPGVGTAAGAGTGALAGSALAQEIELAAGLRAERSAGRLAADTALGLFPGARIGRELGTGARVGLRAVEGGALGLGHKVIETGIDEGRLPTATEALAATGTGGIVGGGLEGGATLTRAGLRRWRRRGPVIAEPPAMTTPAPVADTTPPGPAEPLAVTPSVAEPTSTATPAPLVESTPPVEAVTPPVDVSAGATTPAGFTIAPGTEPIRSGPMPEERVRGVAQRLARTPEEAAALEATLQDLVPDMERQTRGVVSHEEAARFADALEPPGTIPAGQALNREELETLYRAAQASRDRVDAARLAADAAPGDAVAQTALQDAETAHARRLLQFAGARSEAGRSLGGLRGKGLAGADPVTLETRVAKAVSDLHAAGRLRAGIEPPDLVSRLVAHIDDPATATRLLRDLTTVPVRDRLRNWVYFAYLSRPATQVRNILGNTEALGEMTVGRAAAVGLGERGATAGELGTPLLTGARTGVASGIRKAFEILRDGITREDRADPDFLFRVLRGDSPSELVSATRRITGPGDSAARRWGSRVTQAVPRSLAAADAFFQTVASEVALHQGAYHRAASAAGGDVVRRRAIAAELIANPTDELRKEVSFLGRRAAFQEQPGEIATAVQQLPEPLRLFILPFIRTPANILRRAVQKVPGVGAITASRDITRQLRAAGLKKGSVAAERVGAQVAGEHALGYLAIAPLVYLAATHRLQGEPADQPAARGRFYEQGGKPNSLRVGDRTVPLSAFGSAGIVAQSVTTAVQRYEATRDAAGFADAMAAAAIAAGKGLRDVSFLNGIGDLFDSGTGATDLKAIGRLAGRKVAGALVPGVVQDVERVVDPTIRRSRETGLAAIPEEITSRVPGLSPAVPPLISSSGAPREEALGTTLGARAVSVITGTGIATSDPVLAELDRLQVATGTPVGAAPIPDRIVVKPVGLGRPTVLEPDRVVTYQQAMGQARAAAIARVLQAPDYDRLSDVARAARVKKALSQASTGVRRRMELLVRAGAAGRPTAAFTVDTLRGVR